MRKCLRLMLVPFLALAGSLFTACDSETISVEINSITDDLSLKGFDVESVDSATHVINLSPNGKRKDSLYFENLDIPEGGSAYLAANDDLLEPEIDWDSPVSSGIGVALGEDGMVVLVVLDERNRVSEVWQVKVDVGSSSSTKSKSSSSTKKASSDSKKESSSESKSVSFSSEKASSDSKSSSSGLEKVDCSSSVKASSSSVKGTSSESKPQSSSDKAKSSSSQEKPSAIESSSSEAPEEPKTESSSSLVESSSDIGISSSEQVPQLSSDKSIDRIVFSLDGTKRSDLVPDISKKVIDLGVVDEKILNSIQVFSIYVADGAVTDLPVKTSLTMKELSVEETIQETRSVYGYDFTITAEDGSADTWSIVATIVKINGVLLGDFGVAVKDSSITVNGNSIYVEVPYGTDLTRMTVLPMDTVADLSRGIEMEFIDEGVKKTYTVKAGMQLPGTDFESRDMSGFWATTSDAMATEETSAKCVLLFDVKVKSSANLEFSDSKATLTTRIVEASAIGIEGGWKVAGGFYFTGEFRGGNALELYEEGRSSGCPLEDATVDMTKMMTFGKSFTGRPVSFDVDYSYVHERNSSSEYPQKSLIYVMLLSADSELVASGAIVDDAPVTNASKNVELVYGGDPYKLLSSGYPVASGINIGEGDKPVASIHVMFASSAYAHVVAGGIAGNSDEYRGGENSKLILDNFKLNY